MNELVNEYEAMVARMRYKNGAPMPLAFVCLGLAGEAGEVVEAQEYESEELLDELGDLLWYATAALQLLGGSLARTCMATDETPVSYHEIPVLVGDVCDIVKKDKWHGQPMSDVGTIGLLEDLVEAIGLAAYDAGMAPIAVMEANIDKLQKRYPGGFVEGGGIRA